MPKILYLKDVRKYDEPMVGEKAALLGEVYSIAPVPTGFILSNNIFNEFVSERIDEIYISLNNNTLNHTELAERIGAIIRDIKITDELRGNIYDAYIRLCAEASSGKSNFGIVRDTHPVLVRADIKLEKEGLVFGRSYALRVIGIEALLDAVRSCLAQVFESDTLRFMKENRIDFEDARVSVLVQAAIYTHKSGIVHTYESSSNDESRVEIMACWGTDDYFAKDDMEPSRYAVDKTSLDIVWKKTEPQDYAYVFDRKTGEKTKKVIPEDEREINVLNKEEIIKLAKLGLLLEKHFSMSLKIEFVIEKEGIYIIEIHLFNPKGDAEMAIESEEKTTSAQESGAEEAGGEEEFVIEYEPEEYSEEEPGNSGERKKRDNKSESEGDFEARLRKVIGEYIEATPELEQVLRKLEKDILDAYRRK